MRITKKILSLLLVVSMIASFFAMTGFEASANLQNQQKTDFGIHFDDTTRKLKVLQLPDIQTSVSGGSISERTRETIRLLMQRYNPDVILLTGDQTQGGSSSTKAQWESAVNRVYNSFSPYMKSTCKVIATPGNHEYNFGSLNHQWEYQMDRYSYFVDWDNNFSTIDLDGAPGAGNVTVSASSTNKAVALNFAIFNSKGDEDEGYLRPGGDNETAYNQIVQWYTNMNNTLAGSQYSYKAQVTGQPSAYVPAFASQHVILQEIYTTGALIQADASNGVPVPSRYTHLVNNWAYVRLDPANNPSGAMNEGPCPTWLGAGSTAALYNALLQPGNCLGMTFGHDHDNYFDVVDDNGFHFYMGGALTQENYNTDQNPKGRYFEFTLNDATGDVDVISEVKSYSQLSVTVSADVTSDRIEAINGDGVQLVNTLSVPKTVYIGSAENLADVRAKQEFGNVVQTQLLDYKTKTPYDQDLAVSYCLPSGATDVTFSAHRTTGNAQATLTNLGTETTSEGVLYKYAIKGESVLTAGEYINYTVWYKVAGVQYEIRNSTVVENIKQPAGYNDWFRGYRESNNSKHYVDLAYIGTLSGPGAYSVSRETSQNSGDFNSNTYYNYSLMISDVDQSWYNKAGDTRFSMFRFSPSRTEVTGGLVSQRAIYASPRTDIYLDASALPKVSATDSRLDTGVSIDFWVQKDLDRGFVEYISGIGFYAGDQDFVPSGATIDWDRNVRYDSYNAAISAENDSTGSGGTIDEAKIFFYETFAHEQSLYGLGTTHQNGNLLPDNKLGNMAGQYKGYPLVVDSKEAALALNGKDMTMFTGVRNKGSSDGGYRILLYAVAPYYLNFHTYDKGALRELTMAELMNPRKQSDYPNATQQMWDAYMSAYQNALTCYAQTQTTQTDINNFNTALNNAIAALLNSNKGKPDNSLLLQGKSQFASIDIPPIIYVSGSAIQTAAPYTDRTIKFDVPSGATNVSCVVVNASNDNVNSAVTLSPASGNGNSTHYEYTVSSGSASAGGSIYYKLSYTLPQDLNQDGKNDTYTQYAASYVKGVPNKEGMWIHRTRRSRSLISRNTRIFVKTTLTMDNNIFASRGVSGIMALYGGVQGTSFHTTVVNGTTNEYTRYGEEKVFWAVGTEHQWPSPTYWTNQS
ncbi:MAG: metallophosphoesterase, partial [Clostridia bacterium]|nr:metallophosphoesterase [Clostridia bacterium]